MSCPSMFRMIVAALTPVLAAVADEPYQYIVTAPTTTDTSVSSASSASSLDLLFANRGEWTFSASFSSLTRTADASAGIALKTTEPQGLYIILH